MVMEPASRARMLRTRTSCTCWQPGPAPQVMGRQPPLPLHVALRASCPWAASCRRALELYTLALSTQVALAAVVSEPASPARMLRTRIRSARGQPGWSWLAKLCLLRVVPRTRGPCAARRGVLELFILVLSTLAALPAVVWELA